MSNNTTKPIPKLAKYGSLNPYANFDKNKTLNNYLPVNKVVIAFSPMLRLKPTLSLIKITHLRFITPIQLYTSPIKLSVKQVKLNRIMPLKQISTIPW